jgi:membrane protease YdiL (CAAX protease family)
MNSTIERKHIFIFVAITYGLTAAVWILSTLVGRLSDPHINLSNVRLVLMFVPMIAHLATRLITREGWSNIYLRPDFSDSRWRYYLAAWLLPFAAAIVGGAVYYLLFPGHFDPMMSFTRGQTTDPALASMAPGVFFITQLGLALITPWAFALLVNLGEEFGWRAYLLPKLTPFGMGKAILLVGVIHGIWHWPSIFQGSDYGLSYWGAPFIGPLLFVVMCCISSVFYTWVTLRTGSVWPAVLFHGAFNNSNRLVWIFFIGDMNAVIGPGAQGVIGMLGYAVFALLIILNPHSVAQPASTSVTTA